MTSLMSLDDLRVAVRSQKYENSLQEAETTKNVDEQIFDRVRTFEAQTVSNAEDFIEDTEVHVSAADEIATELRRGIRFRLAEGSSDAGEDIVTRYDELRRMADTAISALERAGREAVWHMDKAGDPYGRYIALTEKYKAIKPNISY